MTDEIPESAFDFAHSRTFLMHIPERELAVRKMKDALKPGGWIFLEEPNFATMVADYSVKEESRDLYEKVKVAQLGSWMENGVDPYVGAKLYAMLMSEGFESVVAEGETNVDVATADFSRFAKLTSEQLRERILSQGILTENEFERYLALYDDPTFAWQSPITMKVWGRKPLS